jgi:hypothetical protein
VTINNAILQLATDPASSTGVTVAAPITASAAGCRISGSRINFGVDADQIVTVGLAVTSGADDFTFADNYCFGATAAECTTFMDVDSVARLRIIGCQVKGATSSTTVGVLRFKTTAPTDMMVAHSFFTNKKALSVHAITGVASMSGDFVKVGVQMLDNANTVMTGTSQGLLSFHDCTLCNVAGETSMIPTVQSTA